MNRPTANQSRAIADASSGPVTFAVLTACVVACCLVVMDWLGIPAFEVAGVMALGALKIGAYAFVAACLFVGTVLVLAAGRDE